MTVPLIIISAALWAALAVIAALRQRSHPEGASMAGPTALASVQLSRTQTADPAGTFADATNSNVTVNTGATVFRFVNTDTASHTVTFVTIPSEDGLALADLVVTIAASATAWLSGFDTATFGSQMTWTASSALLKVTALEP